MIMITAFKPDEDQEDFKKMLNDIGMSGETVDAISKNDDDRININTMLVEVSDSKIHGKGLFALSPIQSGDVICPARIDGKRTQAGRYTNHSKTPNAKMTLSGQSDIDLVSIKNISSSLGEYPGEEITIDYRQAVLLTQKIGELCQQ